MSGAGSASGHGSEYLTWVLRNSDLEGGSGVVCGLGNGGGAVIGASQCNEAWVAKPVELASLGKIIKLESSKSGTISLWLGHLVVEGGCRGEQLRICRDGC